MSHCGPGVTIRPALYSNIMTTEILKIGVPNANGNIYTRECVELALLKGRVFNGQLGFGEGRLHMQRISHCISKLEINADDVLVGELAVLHTPYGDKLGELLAESPYAVEFMLNGSLIRSHIDEVSNSQVIDEIDLMSIDAVQPSGVWQI